MKVLLVNMPFAGLRPAIGASLLKAHLEGIGCTVEVRYLNLRFAERIGTADYTYIADETPTQSLAGDWVFAPLLNGARPAADAAYRETFSTRFGPSPLGGDRLALLERARAATPGYLDDCLSTVDWSAYDIVGFTTTFTQNVASLALARRIKQRYPSIVIAFGGANCEERMGLGLHRSFPFLDYVFSGEADLSLPRVVQALRDGQPATDVPGVISRVGGASVYTRLTPDRVKDLDDLPYPDFSDYFEQLGLLDQRYATGVLMESSRGCWWGEKHHCTFCGLNGTSMAFRSKSAGRVLAELTDLSQRYRARHVEMVDNILDLAYFHERPARTETPPAQTGPVLRDQGQPDPRPGPRPARGRRHRDPAGDRESQHVGPADHAQGHHRDAEHPVAQVVQGVRHQGLLEPHLRLPG